MSKALPMMFLLLLSVVCVGQTTYSSSTPYYCKMTSYGQPIKYFNQFDCWGINYEPGVEFFFDEQFINRVELAAPGIAPGPFSNAYITSLTAFTLPDPLNCESGKAYPASEAPCTTLGTYAFNWTYTDSLNIVHTGSASATWHSYQVCGGRGCVWWSPELVTNSLTLN